MRTHTLILALAAIVCCFVLISHGTSAQDATTPSVSSKWEYKVVNLRDLALGANDPNNIITTFENSLNDFGNDGWELCMEVNGGLVLKRPQ